MTGVPFTEIGTEHAWWCQTAAAGGPCRATIKTGLVKAATVVDGSGLTVTLTADDGNQIQLSHTEAAALLRHLQTTLAPATHPGGIR